MGAHLPQHRHQSDCAPLIAVAKALSTAQSVKSDAVAAGNSSASQPTSASLLAASQSLVLEYFMIRRSPVRKAGDLR